MRQRTEPAMHNAAQWQGMLSKMKGGLMAGVGHAHQRARHVTWRSPRFLRQVVLPCLFALWLLHLAFQGNTERKGWNQFAEVIEEEGADQMFVEQRKGKWKGENIQVKNE